MYNYREQKQFDANGELIVGWTGQLDSERFSAQLDRQILTEDNFRGRFTQFVIGDNMRIKPQRYSLTGISSTKRNLMASDGTSRSHKNVTFSPC